MRNYAQVPRSELIDEIIDLRMQLAECREKQEKLKEQICRHYGNHATVIED